MVLRPELTTQSNPYNLHLETFGLETEQSTPLPEVKQTVLPEVVPYPPIVNPTARDSAKFAHDQVGWEEFRQQEINQLAEQLHGLPHESFVDTMTAEMERLRMYYDAIGKLYGVDLYAVARTRITQLNTVMVSSFLFLQNMFPEAQPATEPGANTPSDPAAGKEVRTFFDSRKESGGFNFNANGGIDMAGYTAIFSVLKRTVIDNEGKFEIDYPVYSLPREVFVELQDWHEEAFPGQEFRQNAMLNIGQILMSRRVHDWIHAAIIYDSKALTQSFQSWSENSFFVEHLLDDPGMINYELLANHLHYQVWQEFFKNDPATKEKVLADIAEYTQLVEKFSAWIRTKEEKPKELADNMGIFMAYLGVRSTFDILRYDDEELQAVIAQSSLATEATDRLPPKTKKFLDQIYQPGQAIPFRKGADLRLSVAQILQEYKNGLIEEARAYRAESLETALLLDNPQGNEVPLSREYEHLPPGIQAKMISVEIRQTDPRIFKRLNEYFAGIAVEHGEEMVELLDKVTDVDRDGYFYLQLDQEEVDFTLAEELTHQKGSFLFQIPYDYPGEVMITLSRSRTVITQQQGSRMVAKPGDIVLVNVQNKSLIEQLLDKSKTENGGVAINDLLSQMDYYAENGFAQLSDRYVYGKQNMLDTFDLPAEAVTEENDQLTLKPGYYVTKHNQRRAMQTGPVSVNVSATNREDRRRITGGAIVENHIKKPGQLDIFPVQEESLHRFYQPGNKKQLPWVRLRQAFFDRYLPPAESHEATIQARMKVRELVQATMEEYEKINDFLQFGARGKPARWTVGDLLKMRENGSDQETTLGEQAVAQPGLRQRVRAGLGRLFRPI